MHNYRAFGLDISSEILIPELRKGEGTEGDVTIRYGTVEKPQFDRDDQHSVARWKPDGHVYYIRDIGGVRVENGDTIIARPLSGAEERGFRFLVSGIALGLLLHQRGFVTLHASAVALRDQAVGFVGPKGMGKSTTAAAFHARNHSVVTDDLLVLDTVNGQVRARPGYPHLKLYPESIKGSLNEDPDHIPKIDPTGTKRSYEAKSRVFDRSLPLRCLYVLDYGDARETELPRSRELKGGEACIEIVRQSYVARLLPNEAVSADYLKRCAEIVKDISVRRLYRRNSLAQLPELVSYIEQEQELHQQTLGSQA